eukprot:6484990-Prymnesium_polylepis.1
MHTADSEFHQVRLHSGRRMRLARAYLIPHANPTRHRYERHGRRRCVYACWCACGGGRCVCDVELAHV